MSAAAATSPCEVLALALGNLYAMLTERRGFVAEPAAAALFARWPLIRQMPVNSTAFRDVCEQLYRLGLLAPAPAAKPVAGAAAPPPQQPPPPPLVNPAFAARRHNADWLALSARNLLFVQPAERPPAHEGVDYSLVLVVLTARTGAASVLKLKRARASLSRAIEAVRAQGLAATSGRIVRVILNPAGRAPANVVPARRESELLSLETWYTSELQTDPTQHVTTPLHRALLTMSAAEIAPIPKASLAAPVGDALLQVDPIARWYGYRPGQMICIERRQLFEGGTNYEFRLVE